MQPLAHLAWPFFDPGHTRIAASALAWAASGVADEPHATDRGSMDLACRTLVGRLGKAGLARYCVRAADGGALADFDVRTLCLLRETFAWHDGRIDFAFGMQGLGSGALSLFGSPALRARFLPGIAQGSAIGAFALSEPNAGSDVAALSSSARRDGDAYVLSGTKTWISNGGIADFYCVFARTSPAETRADGTTRAKGISAFVVTADAPGLRIAERLDVIAPHPLARLEFHDCRIPAAQLIGAEGDGFGIAMQTLDVFRVSVAAAALGFARRALDEAIGHASSRQLFGRALAAFQLTQATLAEMATELDAATLLTYRAAWLRDRGEPVTKEAAMAKLAATESAQSIIDRAVQMFGGRGVTCGEVVEQLYRQIRALRIYEGASEVQKLIIGRELLKGANP